MAPSSPSHGDQSRAQSILQQLAGLEGPHFERRLEELCASDNGLKQQVLVLWERDHGTATVAEGPGLRAATDDGHFVPGTTFSHYRLRELIGRGGMGEVYAAVQTSPITRDVAIKVIKPGMDSRQVLARFQTERQALARMDHPNIARVFDAGTAPDGRPFFAMELVRGTPISRFCEEQRLDTDQRLKLFLDVCSAVQHAHHKGVIHRDLKPTNILVGASSDPVGLPVPKIIDFGVAKALTSDQADSGEVAAMTQLGQVVGTPDYMSPEQADLEEAAVDTRTDVYSLGVVLYELLVGVVPLAMSDTTESTPAERARRLRDEEPTRPSARVLELSKSADSTISTRWQAMGETASELARRYRRDLDWIVLKALSKEQDRRYGGPAQLAADIERHLNHQPVIARAPSRSYRVRKFVRRHRAGVAAATAAVVTLTIGVIGTSYGLIQARKAEAEAVRQADLALQQSRTAEQVSNFLIDLFDAANPFSNVRPEISAQELLDQGVQQLEQTLGSEPATKARLLRTMGGVYEGLGDFDESARLLNLAISLHTDPALDTSIVDEAIARAMLADVEVERGQLDDALIQAQLAAQKARSAGDDRALGAALTELASVQVENGSFDEADANFAEAIVVLERAQDARRLVRARYAAVQSMLMRGQYREAEAQTRSVIETLETTHGADHLGLGSALMALGEVTVRQERFDEAGDAFQRAHELFGRVLGPEHSSSLRATGSLAAYKLRTNQPGEAQALLADGLALAEQHHPQNKQLAALFCNDLGKAHEDLGELDQARRIYEKGIRLGTEHFGAEHPFVAFAYNNLGSVARKQGDFQEALRVHQRSLELKRAAFSDRHPSVLSSLQNLGLVYAELGNDQASEAHFREGLELADQLDPVPALSKARLLKNLAALLERNGRDQEAQDLRHQADLLQPTE